MMSTVSEKLLQVAQNNPKVYHSGQLNIVKNAECLKGSKSGSTMLLDDVSPVSHDMGVKVSSKNLITYPYNIDTSTIPSGVTVTDNGDGSLTVNGSIMGVTGSSFATIATVTLEAGTYTFSLSGEHGSTAFACYDLFGAAFITKNYSKTTTVTTTKTVKLSIYIPGSYTEGTVVNIDNAILIPQIEKGSTATDYTPYVPDLTAVKVSRYGKNLFDYDSVIFKANVPSAIITKENNGFTFTALSSSAYFNTSNISAFCLKPNTTYTSRAIVTLIDNGSSNVGEAASMGLSLILQTNSTFDSSGKGKIYIVDGYQNNTGVFNKVGTHEIVTTFTTPADMTDYNYIVTRVSNNTTVIFKDIQIALGATDYEPYITPTEYTPTADGVVNGVTSLYPNTTLTTDTDGVLIDCEYYKDIDKTFNELTTSVALSGGDS